MSGFLPPVVMKIMADGHQFITETGKVSAAMDASAANAKLTAEKQALAAREAAAAAQDAAAKQAAAAATASQAAEVASLKIVEAQKTAAAAAQRAAAAQAEAAATGTEAAQLAADQAEAAAARTAAAVDLASARQVEAAGRAAAAVELSATKQEAAQAAVRAADEKAATVAELTATRAGNATAKIAKSLALGGGILAAGLGAIAVKGVESAAAYEKQITLLHTAGGELSSALGTVSAGILQISTDTGTSTDELAHGMNLMEKAGFNAAHGGLDVLRLSAQAAKAEGTDMGTMATAVTSVLKSYNKTSADAASYTNMMVAGAGAAKATMQDYAGALSTVLPVASAAGISFPQVAGAIATLTQHGTSAAESTQELSNTIRGLQAPNGVAVKAMQQLGLNVQDVSTHLGSRGLTGTIGLITNKIASSLGPGGLVMVDTMKKSATATQDLHLMLGKMPAPLAAASKAFLDGTMSQKDYQKSFKEMGAAGSSQGKSFLSLAQTAKGYNDTIKAGGPAAQTAAAQLKAIMGGATGMNTALMLSSVAAKDGGDNMKMFKGKVAEVGEAGKKSGHDISTWADTSKTLSVQIDRVKETFHTLAITIGTILAPAAKVLMGGFISLFSYLSSHKDVTQALLIGLGILAGVMLAFYVGTKVAAAGQAAWSTATKIATGVGKLFQASTYDSIRLMGMYGLEAIKNGAKSVGAAVKTGAAWVVNGVKGLAQGAAKLVAYGAAAVAQGARSAGSAVKAGAAWLVNGVKGLAQAIGQLVAYGAAAVAQGARSAGGALVAGGAWVAQGARTVGAFLATGAAMVASGIATGAYKALQLAGAAATGIATAAQWAFNAAMDGNPIMLVIIAVIALVAAVVLLVTHWKEVTAFITAAWSACMSWLTGAINGFMGWWNGVWAGFVSFLGDVWNNIVKGAKDGWNGLINWVRGVPQMIVDGLGALGHLLDGAGQAIINGFLGGLQAAYKGVQDFVGGIAGWIKDHKGPISYDKTLLTPAGNAIMDGLHHGLRSKMPELRTVVKGITDTLTGDTNKHLEIHSPSRVFAKIGNWVTLGLASGVHAKGAQAVAAVRAVAQKLTDAATASYSKAGQLGGQIAPSFSSQKTAEGRAAAAYRALRNSMLSGQARTEMAEGAALDRAAARVWGQLRQIDALATQKVALAARLKDAQKRLAAATAVENKEAGAQTDKLRGEFKLGDMVGYSAAEMVAGTKAVASRILAFGAKIKQLRSLGVNASLVSEVAGLGSQDGTTVADSLIAGGKGQIAQLNSAYGSIQSSTASAGAMVADGMYGAGVDSLKSLANGLTNNMSAIDKAASTIASRLTAGVKAELGLSAPAVHHPAPVRRAAPSSHPLGLPHHAAAPASSHKTVNNHVTVYAKNASANQVGALLGKQLHAMS